MTTQRQSARSVSEAAAKVDLQTLVPMYFHGRKTGRGRRQDFDCTIRWWRELLLREPATHDLTREGIAALYKYCFLRGLSRASVKRHREKASCLVQFAAAKGLIPEIFDIPSVVGRPAQNARMEDKPICLKAGTVPHYYQCTWLHAEGAKISDCIRKTYDVAVNHWLRFCDSRDILMVDIDEAALQQFQQFLVDAGRGENVAKRTPRRIRALLQHGEPDRWLDKSAHDKVQVPAEINGSPTLATRIDAYAASRDISAGYIYQLRFAAKLYSKFLGRPATVADLTADSVNPWVIDLTTGNISAQTARTHRRHLLVIWHDCIDAELTDTSPRRVRKIKAPRLQPNAWTPDEIRRLVEEGEKTVGVFQRSRVSRPAFWKAIILTAWDTGLRTGDLMRLTTEQVRGQSQFWHTQHKTGHPILCRLQPVTVEAIKATYPPERALAFEDALTQCNAAEGLRALVKSAGISPGCFKKIRKSSATAMEIACPGSATAHLGHLTPDMAFKHYLDQGQIQQQKPMAPALPGFDAVDDPEPFLCTLVDD